MSFENLSQNRPIEQTANYEGDHTLLFFERLNNAEVKRKLVESLTTEYMYEHRRAEKDRVEIRMKVENDYNHRIKKVFSSTSIDLNTDDNPGYGEFRKTGWVCPYTQSKTVGIENDGPLSKKLLNLIEAHEKGHGVRQFDPKSPIGKWINKSLDFSSATVTQEELDLLRSLIASENNSGPILESDEQLARMWLSLKDNSDEIVERMSQLKNYFGMNGNEKFTKEHLNYARKNYIKDIGWSSQIRLFLETITKKSEANFLDVINNLGV